MCLPRDGALLQTGPMSRSRGDRDHLDVAVGVARRIFI